MDLLNSSSLVIGMLGALIGVVVIFVNATSRLTKAITSLEVTMKHVVQHSENQERIAELHSDSLHKQDLSIAKLMEQFTALNDKVKILWEEYNRT